MTCHELQLAYDNLPVLKIWQRIEEVLRETDVLDGRFKIDDKPLPGHRVGEVLIKRSSEDFSISGAGYEFDCSSWQLFIKKDEPETISLWDRWMAALSTSKSFVSGYLADHDYEFWQNADDPRTFERHGRPYEHLPMRSNGMPFPLERQVIDISGNPGRRILHDGYIEAVGAVMWLGSSFAERTGADLDALRAADWCDVTEFSPSVLRGQVQDTCFTSDEGREAELQNLLRATLFPNAIQQE